MTPEQRVANTKRLVSASRALLSLQVGMFIGARRIEKILGWLGPEVQSEFPVFTEFLNAVPASLPAGVERLHWSSKALLELDPRLAAIEMKFRARLLEGCAEIIATYA